MALNIFHLRREEYFESAQKLQNNTKRNDDDNNKNGGKYFTTTWAIRFVIIIHSWWFKNWRQRIKLKGCYDKFYNYEPIHNHDLYVPSVCYWAIDHGTLSNKMFHQPTGDDRLYFVHNCFNIIVGMVEYTSCTLCSKLLAQAIIITDVGFICLTNTHITYWNVIIKLWHECTLLLCNAYWFVRAQCMLMLLLKLLLIWCIPLFIFVVSDNVIIQWPCKSSIRVLNMFWRNRNLSKSTLSKNSS